MTPAELRERIIASLREQGFRVEGGRVLPPAELNKDVIRRLHRLAVQHRTEKAREHLARYEPRLLQRIAAGPDVDPARIRPRLVEVRRDSEDELLFRYAYLHWSIPVSPGYGRRIRFLVIDEQNGKLMGLFGLGDPVFSLGCRDAWIGWNQEAKSRRITHVMDAFVLGAVPPYSYLLCAKLVAMLVTCNEVRQAVQRKYAQRPSLIQGRPFDGRLALVTTTSALGRSSVYNRITYRQQLLFQNVGFTRGSGEFHFSNGLYDHIWRHAVQHCAPTAKHERWGTGFRNRREIIGKCLQSLGLSTEWRYHGIRREVFVVPLAANAREYLRGEHDDLDGLDQSAESLFAWFRERWLLPRAARDRRYLDFSPASYALWSGGG